MDNSFNERVRQDAIKYSKLYKSNFLDYEYLICSCAFIIKDYYIISAKENNYQHLIGVNSLISPQEFFDKCYNDTLSVRDFNFIKKGQSEKDVKGSVRRKIKALPLALEIFNNSQVLVEESFSKNHVYCSFATSDNKCTLGFINNKYSVPKTLLKHNELNPHNSKYVDFVFRKKKSEKEFNSLILGDIQYIRHYYDKIKHLLSGEMLEKAFQHRSALREDNK